MTVKTVLLVPGQISFLTFSSLLFCVSLTFANLMYRLLLLEESLPDSHLKTSDMETSVDCGCVVGGGS